MLQEIPQKSVFFCLERPHYYPCHYSPSDKIHHPSAPLSQITHPVATNEPRKHPIICILPKIPVPLHQIIFSYCFWF